MSANQAAAASRYIREIHTHRAGPEGEEKRDSRRLSMVQRFRAQRMAQTILFDKAKTPKQQHRTCWCHRHVVTDGDIPVMRKMDGARARLGKVKTCGSVWACPVCAAKVAEVRRQELTTAMLAHTESGGHAYLVTFTFPHHRGQGLAELMEPFTKARQSFQNCRAWKAVMDKADKLGVITSLEVTYGAGNGWHPHLHMLVFCAPGAFAEGEADKEGRLDSPAIEYLRGEWARILEKKGLVDAGNRHWAGQYGLDVRGGKKAAEYIAKWGHEEGWGLSSELTSSHAKMGSRSEWGTHHHYTPFQLLAMADTGDGHAICAFREFVKNFDGRRMLTWSRGLKKHFKINEVEDDQAAEQTALELADEHQVGEINAEQLQVLTKFGRLGEFLAHVAQYAHTGNTQDLINQFILDVDYGEGRRRSATLIVDRFVDAGHTYFYKSEVLEEV